MDRLYSLKIIRKVFFKLLLALSVLKFHNDMLLCGPIFIHFTGHLWAFSVWQVMSHFGEIFSIVADKLPYDFLFSVELFLFGNNHLQDDFSSFLIFLFSCLYSRSLSFWSTFWEISSSISSKPAADFLKFLLPYF